MSDESVTDHNTLYVTDAELIRRIGVPEKIARNAIRDLDRNRASGFPQKQALWGNRRYWPAVKAWLANSKELSTDDGEDSNEPARIGKVYFLASPTHIKIGFSAVGVKKRVKSIRNNHYETLELLAVLNNVPQSVERRLHQKFQAHKVKGEWFHRVAQIEEFARSHDLGRWRKELMP